MAWLVLLAVIAVPVVEIALFVKAAQWIGVLATVALAVGAGMAGAALLRHVGLATVLRARDQLNRGEVPIAEALDGLILVVAAVLLLLPGLMSDVVALVLLLPPVRALIRRWIAARAEIRASVSTAPSVIDGEFHVVSPPSIGSDHPGRQS